MTASPRTLGIIGAGALGTALAHTAHARGMQIAFVRARSVASAQTLGRTIGIDLTSCGGGVDDLPAVDVLCLCVPDDALDVVARACATFVTNPPRLVVHWSGACTVEVLDAFLARGIATAGVHPLMTFTRTASGRRSLVDVPASVESASADGTTRALAFARELGLAAFAIDSANKVQVHAAAVFAGNYLVTLAAAAERCLPSAGPEGRPVLADLLPLMRAVLDNVERAASRGALAEALSGPIARGDRNVIARHRESLRSLGQSGSRLDELYRTLARATVAWLADARSSVLHDVLEGEVAEEGV